jgi:hypothetical protein
MRELARLAYERELAAALTEVEQAFGRWRAGEIDAFGVEHIIHQFHQGTALELELDEEEIDVGPPANSRHACAEYITVGTRCLDTDAARHSSATGDARYGVPALTG